jgi:hypothetical protein
MNIQTKTHITDEQMAEKEGEYFMIRPDTVVVKKDADIYKPDGTLLARFRKGVLDINAMRNAFPHLLKESQKKMANRGPAAGVLDLKKLPSYVGELYKPTKFRTYYISKTTGLPIKRQISNLSNSSVIGYFDKVDTNTLKRARNMGIELPPCRTTMFTREKVDKWEQCTPFFEEISKQFKCLVPDRYEIQKQMADKTEFKIKNTAFSTITINYNWRTALHKDAGDLEEGFGNLVVIENGKYDGGFLYYPQYNVAIDVRCGDFLAMDVHEWHCNTPLLSSKKSNSDTVLINPNVDPEQPIRLSIVCYLRKDMEKCQGVSLKKTEHFYSNLKDLN